MGIKKRHHIVLKAFLCFGGLLLLAGSCMGIEIWHHVVAPAEAAARQEPNIVYGRASGQDLMMDMFFPTNTAGTPLRVVMYVHGGGWRMGDRHMLGMMPGPVELLRRNYLVVTIDYRLAPNYKFPAMIDDAKTAVRFLRAHAKQYNLDPGRIGVMGDSAGGHLVSLMGLADASAGFEDGDWTNESSRVEAVVDLYGPSDFSKGPSNRTAYRLMRDAFGVTNAADPMIRRASPVTYVTSNAPPFLILHGDHDGLVSIDQSKELNERLKAAGDDSTLLIIHNYSHGYTPIWLKSSPSQKELSQSVADFFDKHL
jgi:acetyl esterase/lipase